MSRRIVLSKDETWLVRLFVLSRAARAPVSEESILAELDERKIGGVATTTLRRILAALLRQGILVKVRGSDEQFNPTRQGRKAVIEAAARLRALFDTPGVSQSREQSGAQN